MTVEYGQVQFFFSFGSFFITPRRKKNDTNFLKTMVGTFCATSTVTSYPCFYLDNRLLLCLRKRSKEKLFRRGLHICVISKRYPIRDSFF